MTVEQAKARFRSLISFYGFKWTKDTPDFAYEELASINKVLTEKDRRDALQGK